MSKCYFKESAASVGILGHPSSWGWGCFPSLALFPTGIENIFLPPWLSDILKMYKINGFPHLIIGIAPSTLLSVLENLFFPENLQSQILSLHVSHRSFSSLMYFSHDINAFQESHFCLQNLPFYILLISQFIRSRLTRTKSAAWLLKSLKRIYLA